MLSCCPLQGLSRPVIRHLELLHHNHTTTLEQLTAPHAPPHWDCTTLLALHALLVALQQLSPVLHNRRKTKLS